MDLISIHSSSLKACFSPYGASLVSLELNGHPFNLVRRLQHSLYPTHTQHFGAVVGPVANRIAGACAEIDGIHAYFEPNEAGHTTLHSGAAGFGRQKWALVSYTASSVCFRLDQPDGALGFPGTRVAHAHFEVTENAELSVELTLHTDKTSLCNMTTHPYFCLDDTGDVASHTLHVNADQYLDVDLKKIPTGTYLNVHNSPFDFSSERPLSMLMSEGYDRLDHNFCINKSESIDDGLCAAARLFSTQSSIEMRLFTNQPGLQIYCPPKLPDELLDEEGRPFAPFPAICLEPQKWPDAPHHSEFPSILVTPDAPYKHLSRYCFTVHSL